MNETHCVELTRYPCSHEVSKYYAIKALKRNKYWHSVHIVWDFSKSLKISTDLQCCDILQYIEMKLNITRVCRREDFAWPRWDSNLQVRCRKFESHKEIFATLGSPFHTIRVRNSAGRKSSGFVTAHTILLLQTLTVSVTVSDVFMSGSCERNH